MLDLIIAHEHGRKRQPGRALSRTCSVTASRKSMVIFNTSRFKSIVNDGLSQTTLEVKMKIASAHQIHLADITWPISTNHRKVGRMAPKSPGLASLLHAPILHRSLLKRSTMPVDWPGNKGIV